MRTKLGRAWFLLIVALAPTAGCIFISDFDQFETRNDGGTDAGDKGVDGSDGATADGSLQDVVTRDVVSADVPPDVSIDGGVDGDVGDAGDFPLVTADDFRKYYLDLMCRKLVECGAKVPGRFPEDERELRDACSPARRFEGLTRGPFSHGDEIDFNAETAHECLRDLDQEGCHYSFQVLPRTCLGVFNGLLQSSDSCESDAECNNGDCLILSDCPGSCVGRDPRNSECGLSSHCELNLVCVEDQCVPPGDAGNACDPTDLDSCEPSFWCNPDTRRCAARPGLGDECAHQERDPCNGTLVCTSGGTPLRTLCARGRTLDESCSGLRPCAPGFKCVERVCVEAVLPGEECESTEQCPPDFACHDDRCVPRPLPSEHCEEGLECFYSDCVDGTCVRLAPGAECGGRTGNLDPCEGFCDPTTNACVGLRGKGASCDMSNQCMDSLACLSFDDVNFNCLSCE